MENRHLYFPRNTLSVFACRCYTIATPTKGAVDVPQIVGLDKQTFRLPSEERNKKMLISLILVGFILWLFFKGVGLALRMTWGLAKLIGVVLMAVALPVAGVCVFMGLGVLLLLPVGLLLLALGLMRT